jgi:hypothetical protein
MFKRAIRQNLKTAEAHELLKALRMELHMPDKQSDVNDWLALIKGEFNEMPGLQLTKPQVRRMWGLDVETCEIVLDTLQASRFLRVTVRGCYALADEVVAGRSASRPSR